MRARILLLIVSSLAALAIVALLVSRADAPDETRGEYEPKPAEPRSVAQSRVLESSTPTREAVAQPLPDAPPRSAQLHSILSGLGDLLPRSAPWDIWSCDLSRLREVVIRNGITADGLQKLLAADDADPLERPVLLAAFAFVPDLPAPARDAILAHVLRDGPGLQGPDFGSSHAGLFALQMKGAGEHIGQAATALLERYPTLEDRDWQLRNLATFALAGVDRTASPECREQVLECSRRTPELGLTSAAFQALCRIGAPGDAEAVLQEALSNGHAREGLESARDAALLPTLESLACSRGAAGTNPVYRQYLAASAARALLSIDSPAGAETFERLALSADPNARGAVERALALDPPASAAATLVRISAEARIRDAPELALEKVRARLAHMTVPEVERERCAAGLRDSLPRLLGNATALRTGLDMFALSANDADRPLFERLLAVPELTEEHRQSLRGAWRLAHPLD